MVREFPFRGELAVTGALSRLGQVIKQEELPSDVLQQASFAVGDYISRLSSVLALQISSHIVVSAAAFSSTSVFLIYYLRCRQFCSMLMVSVAMVSIG